MCIIDATISHATSVIRITHAHPQVEPYPFTSFRLRPPNGAVVGLAHLLLLATTHAHISPSHPSSLHCPCPACSFLVTASLEVLMHVDRDMYFEPVFYPIKLTEALSA